jgi:hypothetical protein
MICDPKDADEELKAFFTLRKAHWPFQMVNTPYAWHWEATYPQPYGYTNDPSKAEMVNVSVAQNLRAADGQVTNMSNGDARGRSFHDGKMDLSPGSVDKGLNFEEQWKRVEELKPPFVMITGWNEWIAGRWGDPKGPLVFVDQFDQQFSRDIEPGLCSHGDNYYWQMVAGIRRYKGAPSIPAASAAKTIRLEGGFDQWNDVAPEFMAHSGETLSRDHDGAAGTHYANTTGRNDIVACKVARDEGNVYFHVRTLDPLTSWAGRNWMWLLIRVEGGAGPDLEGYQFVVNRSVDGPTATWLEKCEGGWTWRKIARLAYRTGSHEMHVAVPRSALGLGNGPFTLDLKWLDNAGKPGDPLDAYVSGDAAPSGRFRYRYVAR